MNKKTVAHHCFKQLEAEIDSFIKVNTEEIIRMKFMEDSVEHSGFYIANESADSVDNKIMN